MWTEICEVRQIFKGDLTKFCEIFTKITLELHQNSQKPLFKCKKLVINTTKCDLYLFLHKMYCKMVWKFCEIWKILWELASIWAKFCDILSQSVRYGMYVKLHLILDLMFFYIEFSWLNKMIIFTCLLFIYLLSNTLDLYRIPVFHMNSNCKNRRQKKKKKSRFSVIIWIYHNILNFQTNGPGQTV